MTILASCRNTRIRILVGCGLIGLFCWQFGRDADGGSLPNVRTASVVAPAIAYTAPLPKPTDQQR